MRGTAPTTHLRDTVATAEDRSLPVVQAGGFGASIDAFAWEPDPASETSRTWLWFVSLVGSQQALKAIWARLLRGEHVTVSHEALGEVHFCALAPLGPKGWRTHTARLPAAGGHQLVLLPELARFGAEREDFLLLPRSDDAAPPLHFRFLDRRVDVPLHASWASWLWERARRTGEAVALEAAGIRAYRCAPQTEALTAELSEAVQAGVLGVPEAAGVARDEPTE
jgi:hypothetical protein